MAAVFSFESGCPIPQITGVVRFLGFHRVNQSLRADNGARSLVALLIAFLLLAAWLTWAFTAKLTRYELAERARIEADGTAYPVQSNVAGRVVSSSLVLGRTVRVGDVLAELDSDAQGFNLAQERTHLATLTPQIVALEAQLQAEEDESSDDRRVLAASVESARAQYREAETQAALAAAQADRSSRMYAEGILSDADMQRAQAEAQSKRAAADNLKAAISRFEPELGVREHDRQARQKQIQADIAKLQAEAAASSAAVRRFEYELAQRRLTAPVSGRLGECIPLRPGTYVSEGQKLGVVVPQGNLQVIAEFAPQAAIGKVRPGQSAIVRLQGFPWTQYGTVPAHVTRVADDVRDGTIRVELALDARHPPSRIPLQHGLPGSVEVRVERTSPAALLLRSVGQALGSH